MWHHDTHGVEKIQDDKQQSTKKERLPTLSEGFRN